MNTGSQFRRPILAAYRFGLNLYPAEFREHNFEEMSRCADEMLAKSLSLATICRLAEDLFRSLLVEHMAMSLSRIPQLAILITLTTFIAGTGYVISQQVLRMSANDPQIQLAEDAAGRVGSGEEATRVVPDRQIDMASSLAPFVIVYDDTGHPVASSARLDARVPAPPRGVLDFVRSNREERVTWQPRPGVRIASVITRTASGFVVAGRNMREVEIREGQVLKLAVIGWIVANCALTALWILTPLFAGGKSPRLQPAA